MTFVVSPKSCAIGAFAGLSSALLVISPVGGSSLSVPLTILSELPLVIVALGWGTSAGIIAVIAGTVALIAVSPSLAIYFTLFLAPPAVIGSHFIGLARDLPEPETSAPDGKPAALEWYPLGRVLVITSLIVPIASIIISIVNGFNPSAMSPEKIQALAAAYADAMKDIDTTVSNDELARLLRPTIEMTMRLLPFMFVLIWTCVAALNLWLGIIITRKSGNLIRPSEDLAAFQVPRMAFAGLIVTGLLATTGGIPGAIASTFAGALTALAFMQGLAVLHTITRRLSFRLPLLILVYLFIGLAAVPLVVLGIIEPYARLRQRFNERSAAKSLVSR